MDEFISMTKIVLDWMEMSNIKMRPLLFEEVVKEVYEPRDRKLLSPRGFFDVKFEVGLIDTGQRNIEPFQVISKDFSSVLKGPF